MLGRKDYQTAIDVQGACNLSGVVHSFSEIIKRVRKQLESEGPYSTEDVNRHPICRLFADKIQSLAKGDVFEAYDECEKGAK